MVRLFSDLRRQVATLAAALLLTSVLAPASVAALAEQTWRGWLAVQVADPPGGAQEASTTTIWLIDDHGNAIELLLDLAIAVPLAGRVVEVRGVVERPAQAASATAAGVRAVLRVVQVRPVGQAPPSASKVGRLPYITVLCRFADSPTVTPASPDYVRRLMAEAPRGVAHYWRQVSYGKVTLDGSAVVGWYNLPRPQAAYMTGRSPDFSLLARECLDLADRDISFPAFAGVNIAVNTSNFDFAFASGLTVARDGSTRFMLATFLPSWALNTGTIAHEIGHNLGLPHSSGPYGKTYDSGWDVMSSSYRQPDVDLGWLPASTIAYHRELGGWLPAQRKAVVNAGTRATVRLERLELPARDDSPLVAVVPISATSWYTVEARLAAGYDVYAPSEGVIIHDVVPGFQRDRRNAQVVDVDANGDVNDAGAVWTVGEVLIDAANGIQIAVVARDGSGLTVAISNRGGPLDGTPPQIVAVTAPSVSSSQRVVATVTATDLVGSDGQAGSGVAAFEYSLDGQRFIAGATIAASVTPGPQRVPIDLAHPAAGGTWLPGQRVISIRARDATGNVSTTWSKQVDFEPATTQRRYLAEGYTGGSFDEYVTIANPSADATAFVSAVFRYGGATVGPLGTLLVVGPRQRVTLSVDQIVGVDRAVAVELESDQEFVAERPMYFASYGSGVTGGHLGSATAAAPVWYFAEGYTGPGFEAYFTILNPNSHGTWVELTYQLVDGSVREREVYVGSHQRVTVPVHHSDPDLGGIGPDQAFSATVAGSGGDDLVVERVQYFRYVGSMGAVTGGTATLGATAPQRTWYFAEGWTGDGFDQYVTIQNPGTLAGTATLTYFIERQSQPVTRQVPLPPRTRTTVAVHQPPSPDNPGGLGRGHANALRVTSDVPVVAERPMYFLYQAPNLARVDGGHSVMGATRGVGAGERVLLAEGYTGPGFHQYLTFQNPEGQSAAIELRYLQADGGSPVIRSLVVPANQRVTVAVHNSQDPSGAGLGTGQAVAVEVAVLSAGDAGVLVERVMYFRYQEAATGGTAAFGVPVALAGAAGRR
ncbi:MAG: hypothetical protein IT340_20255 [Chloroflexi bacterium]|nr:hypothetical protein [Chloroflexota bacterium]